MFFNIPDSRSPPPDPTRRPWGEPSVSLELDRKCLIPWLAATNLLAPMVLILDVSSEHSAHGWTEIGISIYLRHLFISKRMSNLNLFIIKGIFFFTCAHSIIMVPSIMSTMLAPFFNQTGTFLQLYRRKGFFSVVWHFSCYWYTTT